MIANVRQQGATLLEMLIVVAVVGALSSVVVQSLLDLSRSQRATERRVEASAVAERVVAGIAGDVEAAFAVFGEAPASRALLGVLRLGPEPLLRDSRLPTPTAHGAFEADPHGASETGNLLMIGRSLSPIEVTHGGGAARVDLLQVVVYHLSRLEDRIELNRWASAPMARAEDLAAVRDAFARMEVVAALKGRGVGVAWSPTAPLSSAFFGLGSDGAIVGLGAGVRLSASTDAGRPRLLSARRLTVVENGGPGHVPAFAEPLGEFSHGFEVKIDGDGAGSLLLVRLVVARPERGDGARIPAEVQRLLPFRPRQ